MRYTIDLLKGEGVPIRSRPGGIAFACLLIVVPFLLGVGLVSFYLDCEVVLAIQKQQVSRLTTAIETLADAVHKKEALEQKQAEAAAVLAEVCAALGGRTQWSGTLAALVENLSETLLLTRLEARRTVRQYKVPAKDDPVRKVDAALPVRELRISVCGKDMEASAEAVRKLQEGLRSAPKIGPMLDTITVSRSATILDSQEAVLYELQCVFKPILP